MSFGKEKKEEIKPQILAGPSEAQGRSFLQKQLDYQYKPYTEQVFGDFPLKDKLAGLQENIVNRSVDPFYGNAQTAIGNILGAQMQDPTQSPLFAPYKNALLQSQNDALNQFYRGQQAKGILNSTGTGFGAGRIVTDTQSQIGQLLGQIYQNNQNNVLPAISAGANINDYLANIDVNKATNLSNISSILKGIQEQPLQFAYQQDQMKQLFPYQYQVPIAQSLIQNPETFYFPQYKSKSTGIGALVGGIGGAGLGAIVGGPAGAQAGYGIGSGIGNLIYA